LALAVTSSIVTAQEGTIRVDFPDECTRYDSARPFGVELGAATEQAPDGGPRRIGASRFDRRQGPCMARIDRRSTVPGLPKGNLRVTLA